MLNSFLTYVIMKVNNMINDIVLRPLYFALGFSVCFFLFAKGIL
jgi:hypothetical protein